MDTMNPDDALIQALTENVPETSKNHDHTLKNPTSSSDFNNILPSINDNISNIFDNSISGNEPNNDNIFDKEIKLEPESQQIPVQENSQSNNCGDTPPKEKKKIQVTTTEERKILSAECTVIFEQYKYPTMQQVQELSDRIKVSVKKIRSWFQTQRNKARRLNGLIGSGKRLGADEEEALKPAGMKEDIKPVTPERHSMEKREEIPPQVMPQHGFYGNFHPNAYMQQPQQGFYNPHQFPVAHINPALSQEGFDSPFDQSFSDSGCPPDIQKQKIQPTITEPQAHPHSPVQPNGFITPPSFRNNNHMPNRSRFHSDNHFDFESSLADVFKDKEIGSFAGLKLTTHIESIDINALDKYYERIRRHSVTDCYFLRQAFFYKIHIYSILHK